MKKIAIALLLVLALLGGETRESTDPYAYAVNARYAGMGRSAVAYADDALGLLSNPAAIGRTNKMQFGLSSYTLFSEYKFISLSAILPTAYGKFGLSYVGLSVDDIPETDVYIEGTETRVYQTGSYKMGDRVIGLAYILPVPRDYGMLKNMDIGLNFKYAISYLNNEQAVGYGLDAGLRFDLSSLSGYHFGIAAQNILSPKFKSGNEDGGSDSTYATNMRLGASKEFAIFEQKFMGAADYDNNGIHLGLEYYPDKAFSIRVGMDGSDPTLGLGFKSFTFTGFDYQPYTVQLDYAYHFYDEPLENVHLFSFSVLGVTQTKTPTIETSSGQSVSSNSFNLQGTADPESDVSIYINNRLRKSVKATASGVWQSPGIFLDEGENTIYVQAQYEQYVKSEQSNSIKAYCDSTKPGLTTEVFRDGDMVVIKAMVNKDVKAVASKMPDDKKILLKYNEDEKVWEGRWPIPADYIDQYLLISTMAVDNNGTKSEIIEDTVSTRIIEYPKDKTIVLNDSVMIKGMVGKDVKELRVGDKTTVPNEDGTFAITVPVSKIGKNRIDVLAVGNDSKQSTSSIRLLRLQSATDIDNLGQAKREIVDALTLGYLGKADNNQFYPNDYVTRGEFAKALTLIRGLPIPNSIQGIKAVDVNDNTKYNLYIKAVLDAGYMPADLNRFRPDAFIRRGEAITAIVKMDGGIDDKKVKGELPFKDVSANSILAAYVAKALQLGIVQSDDYLKPNAILDKASAAMMLAKSKYAIQQINNMYNWKRGYGNIPEAEEASAVGTDDLYLDGVPLSFDNENQKLKIISPQDQDVIYQETVSLRGIAKDKNVTVNGIALPVNNKNGMFAADVKLNLGKNLIVVEGAGEIKNLRLLRIKQFKDLEANAQNYDLNILAQYYGFEDGNLDKEKVLRRNEMSAILSALQNKQSIVTDNAEVSWQEALLALNSYAGFAADDKTLVKDLKAYQPESFISRGAFMEMLLRTPQLIELLKGYKDYESFTDKYKPQVIQNRISESGQRESDSNVAFNISGAAAQKDFSNYMMGDPVQAGGDISRSGDSIVSGGTAALVLSSPPNKFLTTQTTVSLKGRARGEKNVKVNEQKITLAGDGSFDQQVALSLGKNTFILTNGAERIVLTGVRLATFTDIKDLKEKRSIEYLTTLGFFQQGTVFNPQTSVTRGEFAALLVRLLNEKPAMVYEKPYPDVTTNDPLAPSLQLLKQKKIIAAEGNFDPQKIITCKEAYSWFSRVSRATVENKDKEIALQRIDVVKWFIKDSRVQDQINNLRA